ncbi:MAG: hypothetical protein ACTSRU_16515, partial [Candidatus Hodarchaeales archaeon]
MREKDLKYIKRCKGTKTKPNFSTDIWELFDNWEKAGIGKKIYREIDDEDSFYFKFNEVGKRVQEKLKEEEPEFFDFFNKYYSSLQQQTPGQSQQYYIAHALSTISAHRTEKEMKAIDQYLVQSPSWAWKDKAYTIDGKFWKLLFWNKEDAESYKSSEKSSQIEEIDFPTDYVREHFDVNYLMGGFPLREDEEEPVEEEKKYIKFSDHKDEIREIIKSWGGIRSYSEKYNLGVYPTTLLGKAVDNYPNYVHSKPNKSDRKAQKKLLELGLIKEIGPEITATPKGIALYESIYGNLEELIGKMDETPIEEWERDEIWLLPIDERVPLMKIHERGGISKYREGQIGELDTLQCLVGRGLLTLQKGDDYLDNIYTLTDEGRAMANRNPYSEDGGLQTYDTYFRIILGLWRDTIDDPMLPNVGNLRIIASRRPLTWEDLNIQSIRIDILVLLENETYWKELLKVVRNGVQEIRSLTVEEVEKKNKELKNLEMRFLGLRGEKVSIDEVRKRLGLKDEIEELKEEKEGLEEKVEKKDSDALKKKFGDDIDVNLDDYEVTLESGEKILFYDNEMINDVIEDRVSTKEDIPDEYIKIALKHVLWNEFIDSQFIQDCYYDAVETNYGEDDIPEWTLENFKSEVSEDFVGWVKFNLPEYEIRNNIPFGPGALPAVREEMKKREYEKVGKVWVKKMEEDDEPSKPELPLRVEKEEVKKKEKKKKLSKSKKFRDDIEVYLIEEMGWNRVRGIKPIDGMIAVGKKA